MLSIVASRYARALADVIAPSVDGTAQSVVDTGARILADLRAVEEVITGSQTLRTALASPAVAPSRKHAVMRRLLEPMGLDPRVRNFIYVIVDHRRAAEYPTIVDAFEHVFDERMGLIPASVSSAQELTGEQRAKVEAQVTRLAGRMTRVKFSTDPSLIGGVIAKIGSTVYDGSVRSKLERLRTQLAAG